jgi:hypothetical protein
MLINEWMNAIKASVRVNSSPVKKTKLLKNPVFICKYTAYLRFPIFYWSRVDKAIRWELDFIPIFRILKIVKICEKWIN